MKSAVLSSAIKLCKSWGFWWWQRSRVSGLLRLCQNFIKGKSDAELVAGFQVLEEPETDWMEQPGVDFMFNTTAFIKALLEEGVFYCENMPDVLLWDWRFNSEKTPPEAAKKYPPASQSLVSALESALCYSKCRQ
eukprot:797353-Rhodomonas_salina.1